MPCVNLQRLCAHSGDEDSGECECDGCVCPKGSVAFNRMCLYNVSDMVVYIYMWTEKMITSGQIIYMYMYM